MTEKERDIVRSQSAYERARFVRTSFLREDQFGLKFAPWDMFFYAKAMYDDGVRWATAKMREDEGE